MLAVVTATLSALSLRAEESVSIILINPPGNSEVIHRDLSPSPILCTVFDAYVYIVFLDDLGLVSVEIENQTTGDYSQTTTDALIGHVVFPISSSTGQWTITFTLMDGRIYYGVFLI